MSWWTSAQVVSKTSRDPDYLQAGVSGAVTLAVQDFRIVDSVLLSKQVSLDSDLQALLMLFARQEPHPRQLLFPNPIPQHLSYNLATFRTALRPSAIDFFCSHKSRLVPGPKRFCRAPQATARGACPLAAKLLTRPASAPLP